MKSTTYKPSVHLFVDMDGTLATWKQAACFEDLLQENYFRDLPPYEEVVDAINWLNSIHPEIDIHILSAYMPENPYSVREKNEWLDTYLPAIPKANRIFVAATFGLFTNGMDKFDEAVEKGLIYRVMTTNLVYQPQELLSRDYYISVDMSKYVALLIDTLNRDQSISDLLNPTERIQNILVKYGQR